MKINKREIGSYEITFFDKEMFRVKEIVSTAPYFEIKSIAEKMKKESDCIESYYISKIIYNSLFN